MTEPVKNVVVPPSLRKHGNGRIPATELRPIRGGGVLWYQAAIAWNRMHEAAARDGVKIVCVSEGYRPLLRQEQLFRDRYVARKTLRRPEVRRFYRGEWWWLKIGKSPSATPGTSNHGWGLAQDIKVPKRTFRWMCENAPKFGFYLQGKSTLPDGKPNPEWEAWHWQYANAKEVQ